MRAAAATCVIALALAGCHSDEGQRAPVERGAREAADVVERLERAIARRDFGGVCERLFSRALRERLGGGECPQRLRRSARGVSRPRIRVRQISLRGARADVRVVTTAARQAPARDTLLLVREGGRYRVDGLGER